ncbi:MAG: thioredoxin-like domain-containing protein [Jatrophihabitantaceae bacterium]
MSAVRAPELLASAYWLNVDSPLTIADQRGRFVLLDFWTFCCANCLHVLDELRPLEAQFGDILTVIGVHSPKFAHEADPAALAAACERHEVLHPVVNDPELWLWQQYAVRAWPTLVLIDPLGYVVAQAAGEGQITALAATIRALAAEHEARGTLRRSDAPFHPLQPTSSTLRFPAKAVVLPAARTGRDADTLLVADAGQHALVELSSDLHTPLRRIGSGVRGLRDGPAEAAQFAEPNGLALLPAGLVEYDVVVADTANHVLRGIRLSNGAVLATIDLPAALRAVRTITGPIPDVLSPWDVAWWPAAERLVVAAAGVHLLLSVDPVSGAAEVLAGTTVEGLRDGPAPDCWLAQPSGLAVDGSRIWFVDAETSALRYLTLAGELHTVVGEGLFDFGHMDGPGADARLQHPLGVAMLADGSVAVCDTYNGAIRRYDPTTSEVSTLVRDLAEPSGALLVDGELVVIESAAHRLVRTNPAFSRVIGAPLQTQRAVTDLGPGTLTLRVEFKPAPGRKLDDQFGASTRLTVSASPPELLTDGAGDGEPLTRTLRLGAVTEGVLHITAQAASCDQDGEHPACYLARQDWGVPIRIRADGPSELSLVLLG